ncbi:dioxygenase [Spongiactinospora rosea]|uniref:Dioxygenase n=1 Tax=Spongiactinospora rosea TaxID=2248750 RepID=A0A366LQN3_9ACTN|nr:dioxygenase [Spongiactinospora rosea]RBQ16206.1 dioxygenase [Spongiactinospora rosea]
MDAEYTGRVVSRKTLLRAAILAAPIPVLLQQFPALAADTEPTPDCEPPPARTPLSPEGPEYRPTSPLRDTFTGRGAPLIVSGCVYNLSCRPIANALLDFWHADASGNYDNVGDNFRGHQFTNAQGQYRLTTIFPGLQYYGRTRHIHVKVQARGRPILTTQLFFPNEPQNILDWQYDPRLLMAVPPNQTPRQATFDFVLNFS